MIRLVDFGYETLNSFEFIAPFNGKYEISLWGSTGMDRSTTAPPYAYGGKGGYVKGTINLTKGTKLFVKIGGTEGKNGGAVHPYKNTIYSGDATDVRVGTDDLYHRILVAAGGGSCGAVSKAGGHAGGLTGSVGNPTSFGTGGEAASQTAGGAGSSSASTTAGGFGTGGKGSAANSGYGGSGGAGWFGGAGVYPDGSSDDDKGGGGGSSFALQSSNTSTISTVQTSLGKTLYSGITPSNYYFTDVVMKAGSESMPNPRSNDTSITGNNNLGWVRIESVLETREGFELPMYQKQNGAWVQLRSNQFQVKINGQWVNVIK